MNDSSSSISDAVVLEPVSTSAGPTDPADQSEEIVSPFELFSDDLPILIPRF